MADINLVTPDSIFDRFLSTSSSNTGNLSAAVSVNDPGVKTREDNTSLVIIPFGEESTSDTFTLRVTLWYRILNASDQVVLHIPEPYDFTVVLGDITGVAGSSVLGSNEKLAKRIIVKTGPVPPFVEISNPQDDKHWGKIIIDAHGAHGATLEAKVASSSDKANALFAWE